MRLVDPVKKASREAWTTLTPIQKRVWNLCRKQGLSTWQAGKKLDRDHKTVHENLKLAEKKFIAQLEKIKAEMGGYEDDAE